MFTSSSFPLNFKDTVDFSYSLIYPKQLDSIKRTQIAVDFKSPNAIDIIKGILKNKKVFVVDENNNRNLSDDSIRNYKEIAWFSSEDLIKINYLTPTNKNDFSWLQLRQIGGDLWLSRKEYVESSLNIDNESFTIGFVDLRNSSLTYNISPEIAVISENGKTKDTLYSKEVLELNEFLNLNGNYYRFASISKYGDSITLIKENNFKEKIGTQMGMIAPDFESTLISGENLSSSNLKNKIKLIANTCGCGGDKLSTKAYDDIKKTYGDKIYAIRLDSKIDKDSEGLQTDMEESFNKDIYDKYRQAYCSRTCYVIGENNRIIDKFEIVDWETNLPELLN